MKYDKITFKGLVCVVYCVGGNVVTELKRLLILAANFINR